MKKFPRRRGIIFFAVFFIYRRQNEVGQKEQDEKEKKGV
jgi:hypothetical protein